MPRPYLNHGNAAMSGSVECFGEQALVSGARILAAYMLSDGIKIWIITEAEDDEGERSHTTVLLPSEY